MKQIESVTSILCLLFLLLAQSVDGQSKASMEEIASESKKGDFKMWFDIRIQGDAALYFGAPDFTASKLQGLDNPNHIGSGMALRRTRIGVKAQLDKNIYAELSTDVAGGVLEIQDVSLSYKGVPGLEIKAGNFKESFSIQRNTSSIYLMFMERPMVTDLAPSRHLGLNLTYSNKWFWAAGGVFGPELKGRDEAENMKGNNRDLGRNAGLSYTGKIVFRPIHFSSAAALHLGTAVSYREPKTTSGNPYGTVRYSSRNSTKINNKKYLDTGIIPGLDHELAWTAELAGFYKALRYEAAYIARGAYLDKRINNLGCQWADGWYAQASYLIFGGEQNYDSNGAKPTKITPGRSWGDVEIALRYESCDYNTADYFGGSAEAYSIGVNYYPTKNVKLVLNYQFNNNDRYANGNGKLSVGHDAAGNPTSDCNKTVESAKRAGVDYNMLAFRFQVAF